MNKAPSMKPSPQPSTTNASLSVVSRQLPKVDALRRTRITSVVVDWRVVHIMGAMIHGRYDDSSKSLRFGEEKKKKEKERNGS